jgi:hypothetical protein
MSSNNPVKRPPGGYKTLKATPDLTPPNTQPAADQLEELKLILAYEQAVESAKAQQSVSGSQLR